MHVESMAVEGIAYLIERVYREGHPLQFLRELLKNAIESGAKNVQFAPEWVAVKEKGVYRLSVADDGCGMEPESLLSYMKTIGLSSKTIGGYHDNFGIGARVSTLPWNRKGVLVISWTIANPAGAAVLLAYDEKEKKYGPVSLRAADGKLTSLLSLDDRNFESLARMKPELITKVGHGTYVVCYGSSETEDTYFGPGGHGENEAGLWMISKYLNHRFWNLEDIEVRAWSFFSKERKHWPKDPLAKYAEEKNLFDSEEPMSGTRNRILKGARHYVLDAMAKSDPHAKVESGAITLKDGTVIEWAYRHGEIPGTHAYAPGKGFIAVKYENELYEARDHASIFRTFGIFMPKVAERTTLVITPPQATARKNGGVFPDSARNKLLWKSGGGGIALPWKDWCEEFSANLPPAIVTALRAEIESRDVSDDLDAEEERRIEAIRATHLKKLFLIIAAAGKHKGTPSGAEGIIGTSGNGGGGGGGDGDGDSEKSKDPPGPDPVRAIQGGNQPAKARRKPGGYADVQWKTMEEMGESKYAVQYVPPSAAVPAGLLICAQDFPWLVACEKELMTQTKPEAAADVIQIIRRQIAVKLIYWVASVPALAYMDSWSKSEVQDHFLVSQDVLTAKFCFDPSDWKEVRHRISRRIGALLQEKKPAVN